VAVLCRANPRNQVENELHINVLLCIEYYAGLSSYDAGIKNRHIHTFLLQAHWSSFHVTSIHDRGTLCSSWCHCHFIFEIFWVHNLLYSRYSWFAWPHQAIAIVFLRIVPRSLDFAYAYFTFSAISIVLNVVRIRVCSHKFVYWIAFCLKYIRMTRFIGTLVTSSLNHTQS
jgi:hypothetical protein